jgi:D-alanyl-D-alanine dipeptidase
MYQDLVVITENNYTHYESSLINLYVTLSESMYGEKHDAERVRRKFQTWLSHKDNTIVVYIKNEKPVGFCVGYSAYCEESWEDDRFGKIGEHIKECINMRKCYLISELGLLPQFYGKDYRVELLEFVIFSHDDDYTDFLVCIAKDCPELVLYEQIFHFKRFGEDIKTENDKVVFLHLEKTIRCTKYMDILKAQVQECNEELVSADYFDSSIVLRESEIKLFPYEHSRKHWLVRKEVALKLSHVNKKLMKRFSNLSLNVSYGVRSMEAQNKVFYWQRDVLTKKRLTFTNLYGFIEEIHRRISVPTVAGHTTGGTVDLTLYDKERETTLDMGSLMYELSSDKISWYARALTFEQKKNRKLLFNLMVSEGFAPTMSKWWQFSYGDRQWAVYYNKPYAIYDRIV